MAVLILAGTCERSCIALSTPTGVSGLGGCEQDVAQGQWRKAVNQDDASSTQPDRIAASTDAPLGASIQVRNSAPPWERMACATGSREAGRRPCRPEPPPALQEGWGAPRTDRRRPQPAQVRGGRSPVLPVPGGAGNPQWARSEAPPNVRAWQAGWKPARLSATRSLRVASGGNRRAAPL